MCYVDDGSKDAAWTLIESLQATNTNVHGIKLAHNVGHQNAVWAGLEATYKDYDATITIDADLQDDVHAISQMIALANGGATKLFMAFARNARRTHILSGRQPLGFIS